MFSSLTLGQNTQHWYFSALKSLDQDDNEIEQSDSWEGMM